MSSVIWDGDNIAEILCLIGQANTRYMWEFKDKDEIIGVWTATGMEVAHIGDAVDVDAQGQPFVIEARDLPARLSVARPEADA